MMEVGYHCIIKMWCGKLAENAVSYSFAGLFNFIPLCNIGNKTEVQITPSCNCKSFTT